jgi:hypothetical protein
MTLTTVIGSSGSGKTTFLQDVHLSQQCTYIRQYHNMRPYIAVSKIPSFDPTKLPYWDIYVQEGVASTIQVGGAMAGQFISGLSGGQRKLLLFELICQRCEKQKNMLILLDEPFAGVTDDFVPFIVERLTRLSCHHNLIVVTNDHVGTLTNMADNTLKVSAIDRHNVCINDNMQVNRVKAIAALSLGNTMSYLKNTLHDDLKFFLDVEVYNNKALISLGAFMIVCFLLFMMSFWKSKESITPLVIVGSALIAFFCCFPYLMSLVDWRNAMEEEAEALLHSSKNINKILKTIVTLILIFLINILQFAFVNVVLEGLFDIKYFIAMFLDFISLTCYGIALGIYSNMPSEVIQVVGSIPVLCMIFFSTTFSPGSGLPGLKSLRYLFPRFYFWCMLPSVDVLMEGCPPENVNLLCMVVSAIMGIVGFILIKLVVAYRKQMITKVKKTKLASLMDAEFQQLHLELYGQKVLERLQQGSKDNGTLLESIYETITYTEDGRLLLVL